MDININSKRVTMDPNQQQPVLEPTKAPEPVQEPAPEQPMQDKPAMPAEGGKTNTMAILALVFAFLIPLVGFILSLIAMKKIKETGEGGKGLTIAALIISILGMLLSVFIFFTIILAADEIQDAANEINTNGTIQYDDTFDSGSFDSGTIDTGTLDPDTPSSNL